MNTPTILAERILTCVRCTVPMTKAAALNTYTCPSCQNQVTITQVVIATHEEKGYGYGV